jgi:hypothetical protein
LFVLFLPPCFFCFTNVNSINTGKEKQKTKHKCQLNGSCRNANFSSGPLWIFPITKLRKELTTTWPSPIWKKKRNSVEF